MTTGEIGYWCHVSISYGRHGDDGPVDAVGDVVELWAGGIAFDGIHHRAHGRDEDEHEKEEDEYLGRTDPQGAQEQVAFVDEGEELEDAEDADEAEGADDEQVVRPVEEEAQVDGQRGQQVDDAEEAEDVFPRLLQAVDACQIFHGENQCEQILQPPQRQVGRVGEDVHALQYDKQHTEDDAPDEDDVEQLALGRVRLEDDGEDLLLQLLVVQEVVPSLAQGRKIFHDSILLEFVGQS